MPFIIVRNDITKMAVDAIVNAASPSLTGGGGVDGCIHRAAGPALLEECSSLGGCATGDAKVTGGYDLPAKYVIHTVGPVWNGGFSGEEAALRSCYRRSLEEAAARDCESVAFPLISSGIFGYPKEDAFRVAESVIREFLTEHDMTVYLVLFDKGALTIGEALHRDIERFIDDRYVDEAEMRDSRRRLFSMGSAPMQRSVREAVPMALHREEERAPAASLDDLLLSLDESFSEMLLRLIDERGMTDAACYKKANIDRKLFSKIRSDAAYRPSKLTVLAFAVALELTLPQTKKFLESAGFALSHSNKTDIIIEYFITRKNYDIFEINEALFAFDQPTLGNMH